MSGGSLYVHVAGNVRDASARWRERQERQPREFYDPARDRWREGVVGEAMLAVRDWEAEAEQ